MKIMGVVGAALMTGIALILGQGFAMNWFYKVKSGIEVERFWIEVGKTFIIPIMMCILFIVISNYIDFYNLKLFFTGVMIYTCVYILLLWKFVLNNYEKNLILKPLGRIYYKFNRRKIYNGGKYEER